jgi:hypothetical protein
MPRRPGKAPAEREMRDEPVAAFVMHKLQAHPFRIVAAASEAVVLLERRMFLQQWMLVVDVPVDVLFSHR